MIAYQDSYSFTCEVVDTSSSPIALKVSATVIISGGVCIFDIVYINKLPLTFVIAWRSKQVTLCIKIC